ncbi:MULTISPECIES: IPT/TIG domain-containing protein [unclassified Pseudoalteromonas]|uniref:IPT/TIG domain-containing protein n=1 Tax=unclassified Pseudoalteromonas TaxID=194690 RepID=UPI0030148C4A
MKYFNVLFLFTCLIVSIDSYAGYSVSPNPGHQNDNYTFTVTLSGSLDDKYDLKLALGDGGGGWLSYELMSPNNDRTKFTYQRKVSKSGDRVFKYQIFENDIGVTKEYEGSYTVLPASVSSFTPNEITNESVQVITINGSNLPSTIVANINGSESCTQQSVTSTQAKFNCTPTKAGNQRFYVKVKEGDEDFISGSEDWYVNVTQDTSPSVSGYSPKEITVNTTQLVTIDGFNLPSTIVANINGSESCTQQSVTSTQAKFNCTPTKAGNQRFYVKVKEGDEDFISGSEDWYVNVTQDTSPSVSGYSPKEITVNTTQLVTIDGSNLPSTIVANINGSESCTQQSVTSTQAKFNCTPTKAGNQRFYVKVKEGDEDFISGSEDWYVNVTQDTSPSVSGYSPKEITVNTTQLVTIDGSNLPSTIVANINGSESCTQQSVTSTQAKFNCTPTKAGNQRFYVKVKEGDEDFISGSEGWYVNVTQDTSPSVSGYSPKEITVNTTQLVTIDGSNLPSTIVANINGSESCTQQSVTSTQAKFNCTPTKAGNQRFYVKVKEGDEDFISGSEDWYVNVTQDTSPSVSGYSPKEITVNTTQLVTIDGSNLPSTIVANINGSESCTQQSVTSTQAKFNCTPTKAGNQRFYVKVKEGDEDFISGSEDWYVNVQEPLDNAAILNIHLSGQGKVFTSPSNEIDCGSSGSNCSYQYKNDTQITLVASAAEGWEFSSWSYQPTQTNKCTTAACTLVIKEDLTLTAVFVEQEVPTTDPRLIDFTPKRAQEGSSTTFTLIGENLPEQLIANIQGTLGHCTAININESSATLACTPDAKGAKRFYIKDANDRSKSIAGSEHWYVEVTPAIQSSAPSVWIDNLPDYAILNEQFTITVKSEDVDGDLLSIQADWEGDNNLDRKVNVSNAYGQDVTFSYTRINNDLSDLTLKFIATDASGNESIFAHTIPVVQPQESEEVVSGYEGAETAPQKSSVCEITAATIAESSNPILASNGAKVEHKQLLAVHGVVPITFDISYNSLIRGQSGIGVGWDFANAYAAQIAEAPNGDVTILWSDNQQHKFSPKGDGTYNTESFGCRLDKLAKLEDGTFKVERRNRLTYVFNEFNFLTRIENHKGQGINFEFDEQSRLIKAYDPVSNVGINYRYNQDGFLVEAISTAGRTVYLNYENEQLTKITHADGTVEEFTYNDLDQIVDHLLDSVLISTTTYDNKGRAVEQEDSRDDNQPLRLAYQETDEYVITTITDRNGRVTQKTFDKNYQLVKESNALSHEQNFVYNEDGKPTLITNGRGFSSSMAYTEFGDITKLVTPDGAEDKKEYDANRNMVKHINALGEETLYRYVDGTNNLESVKNALGLVTSFTYNTNNQKLSVTTPEGRTTSFGYTNGLLSSVTNPEGHTRHIYYDLDGFVESETDFLGNITTFERDGLGRVTRKEDPLGFVETWAYDGRGNVLEYADKRYNSGFSDFAGKIQNSYNGQGDLVEKRWVSKYYNKPDVVYSYKYDGESRLIKSTDPNGNVTLIERDAIGRVMYTTDALGNKVEVEFDENGNLIESIDAKGNISKATFDEMDRTTQTEDAAGNKHAFVYNLLGQITKTTNALSQVWQNAYDKLSRLVSVTHPSNADEPLLAKQDYDDDNNVTSITVPAGDIRTLALNNNALVETETTADSVALQYSYNENGLVSTFINGRSQQTSYEYDANSRLINVTDPISTISYGYDQNANPTSVTENDITISRLYDRFNQVAQYKQNDNNLSGVNFLRDVAGNLVQVEYTNNNGNTNLPIKYTYNALNRITSVSGLNQDFLAAKYEYDANQNITKVIRGNGTILENTYDNLNRLTSSIDKAPDGTVILEQHYTYNAIGQIIKEDVTPEYAPPIELISAQAMTYTADNRIETKNTDETFTFDGDGNTLNVGDLALSFNARNQLVSADDHKYTYNAESMRDSLTYSVGNDVTQIRYALLPDYLGLPQIAWQEVTNPDETVDYHYFIYSPYGLVSQHTSKANQVEQDYYFHYDYRGSVVAISNKEGEVIARYGYTPFGKRFDAPGFTEQNQAITTPFGYNGRDGVITDNNGLIYMRARYYSPELRRFVSKDPIRGEINDLGSLNRYAYVGGDPINLVDPSGLTSTSASSKIDSLANALEWFANIAYQGTMGGVIVGNGSDGLVTSNELPSVLEVCSALVIRKGTPTFKLSSGSTKVNNTKKDIIESKVISGDVHKPGIYKFETGYYDSRKNIQDTPYNGIAGGTSSIRPNRTVIERLSDRRKSDIEKMGPFRVENPPLSTIPALEKYSIKLMTTIDPNYGNTIYKTKLEP